MRGAYFAIFLLTMLAFAAALTRLVRHVVDTLDGGVFIPEFVPREAGTIDASMLAVAYAVALIALWLRVRGGLWLVLVLTVAVGCRALVHGDIPVLGMLVALLLFRRSVRDEFVRT